VQAAKRSLFIALSDSNCKQDSKSDSKPAERTVFNKENEYSYYHDEQVILQDPYHGNTDSNKENSENEFRPYYDSGVTQSIFDFISPKVAGEDSVVSSSDSEDFFFQNNDFTSTLDVYIPRESFIRASCTDLRNTECDRDQFAETTSQCDTDMDVIFDISNNKSDHIVPIPFTPPKKVNALPFAMKPTGEVSCVAFKRINVTPERVKLTKEFVEVADPDSEEYSVTYNSNNSPIKVIKKVGERQVESFLSMKTGRFYTFDSSSKALPQWEYDLSRRSTVPPPFPEMTEFSVSELVTIKEVDGWSGERKYFKPTLDQSMDYWSAKKMFKAAGVIVKGPADRAHGIRFGYNPLNSNPNAPSNIFAITKAGNFRHLMVEDAIKAHITKRGVIIVNFDIPTDQELFDPEYHVFGKVIYKAYAVNSELLPAYRRGEIEIDELRGKLLQSYTINTLDPNFPHVADHKYMKCELYVSKLLAHGYASADINKPNFPMANDLRPMLKRRQSDTEDDNMVSPKKLKVDLHG
jgi:hypothetical protein